jgi:uncharacterized protein
MPRELLIIFVKAPRPGHVKTRLAETIGAQAACDAYLDFVATVVGNLGALQNVQLRFSPDDALSEIRQWLRPGWTAAPQGDGDLKQRLTSAFREAFSAGVERVAIIGSDCPDITRDDIESAWSALGDHDVVLGQAEDGGYWLIGLRGEQPSLFQNIAWSTNVVLEETLARAKTANLKTKLLRQLSDIDTAEDLRRFRCRDC